MTLAYQIISATFQLILDNWSPLHNSYQIALKRNQSNLISTFLNMKAGYWRDGTWSNTNVSTHKSKLEWKYNKFHKLCVRFLLIFVPFCSYSSFISIRIVSVTLVKYVIVPVTVKSWQIWVKSENLPVQRHDKKIWRKKKRTAYIFLGMYYSNKCEYMHRPYQMSTSTSDTSFTNMIKSDPIITTSNLAAWRLHEIFR